MRGVRRERNHLYSIRSGVLNRFIALVADVAIHKEHNLFGRCWFDEINKVLQPLYEHRTVCPSTVRPSTVRPPTVRRHSHRTRWTTEKQVVVHLLSGEDHEWRNMSPMCVHAAQYGDRLSLFAARYLPDLLLTLLCDDSARFVDSRQPALVHVPQSRTIDFYSRFLSTCLPAPC